MRSNKLIALKQSRYPGLFSFINIQMCVM